MDSMIESVIFDIKILSLFVSKDINCVTLKSIMARHFLYEFFQGRYRFWNNLISRYFAPVKLCFSLLEGVYKPFVCHTMFLSCPWDFMKTNSMCQQQFKSLIHYKYSETRRIMTWLKMNGKQLLSKLCNGRSKMPWNYWLTALTFE